MTSSKSSSRYGRTRAVDGDTRSLQGSPRSRGGDHLVQTRQVAPHRGMIVSIRAPADLLEDPARAAQARESGDVDGIGRAVRRKRRLEERLSEANPAPREIVRAGFRPGV